MIKLEWDLNNVDFSLFYYENGCRIYVDIMTGKQLSSILLANMELDYWSVRSSSRRGGYRVKGVDCRRKELLF